MDRERTREERQVGLLAVCAWVIVFYESLVIALLLVSGWHL